ncbi:MAG: aminopeptidase N [Propionibacteriaceae bacterium]
MPALALTEARRRAELLNVSLTDIVLDVTDAEHFRSTSTITFTCANDVASTFVDIKPKQLLSVTLNGRDLRLESFADGRLELNGLAADNVLVIDAIMDYSHDGEGVHSHIDPADGRRYLYAMSFLDAAPRWFGCFDQPDLKSRFHLTVTAPVSWNVLGNGPAHIVSQTTQTATWDIAPPHPISTYLVTLAAGEWVSVAAEHDGIRLGLHAKTSLVKELTAASEELVAVTGDAFDAYHRLFEYRYPFGEYHQVFVPDFNAGAMENPGCVLLRDSLLFSGAATTAERADRAGTVAHELAHMWFGDLVTMRWWDDLWLNESFAEYMSHRVLTESGRFELWTSFGMTRKSWGGLADRAPSTHPVAASGAADTHVALMNFDGISYAKGAALVKQLAKRMGDEVFFTGLRSHFSDFAFKNAEMHDLLARWQACGADWLTKWADAWLRTTGMDTLTVTPDGKVLVLQEDGAQSPREHSVDIAVMNTAGVTVARSQHTLVSGINSLQVAPAAEDFLLPDAGDDTWAVVRFAADKACEIPAISQFPDAASRVATWSALRWGVHDGILDPREVFAVLLRELELEPLDEIVTVMLTWAQTTLLAWLPATERISTMTLLSDRVAMILSQTESGSDRKLLLLRSLLETTHQSDWLRDFLAGSYGELSNDPRLRWRAICRLAAVTATTTEIDHELTSDQSAQAVIDAAKARAMVPTAAAKQQALDKFLSDPNATPHELYAIGESIFLPEQAVEMESYAVQWCERLVGLEDHRQGWVIGKSVRAAFPDAVATPAVIAVIEKTLSQELHPAVRRTLVDGLSRMKLITRSQNLFPAVTVSTE